MHAKVQPRTVDQQIASLMRSPLSIVRPPAGSALAAKRNLLVDSAVRQAIQAGVAGRMNQIDPELMPTDRIIERWAVSVGDGLPNNEWDVTPRSRPTPLDAETAIKVDQIIAREYLPYVSGYAKGGCSNYAKRFIKMYYKQNLPMRAIAKQFSLSERAMYLQRGEILIEMRFRFLAVEIGV